MSIHMTWWTAPEQIAGHGRPGQTFRQHMAEEHGVPAAWADSARDADLIEGHDWDHWVAAAPLAGSHKAHRRWGRWRDFSFRYYICPASCAAGAYIAALLPALGTLAAVEQISGRAGPIVDHLAGADISWITDFAAAGLAYLTLTARARVPTLQRIAPF